MARTVYTGQCPTCGDPFESTRKKTYCSNKCRANSPDFKAVALCNAEKARAAHSKKARAARQRRCEQCARGFEALPSSGQRFCSRGCARRHNATIFDDLVAALEDVPVMSNFDEFLSADVLNCPIEGCYWHGEDLGLHVSMAHGIPAAAFKKRAGFNKRTGLVGRALSRRLSDRNRGDTNILAEHRGKGPQRGTGLSPEGREHYDKAMLLRKHARQ